MSWIKVVSKKVFMDEKLTTLGIEPKDEDFYWADSYVRTEDVSDFFELNKNKCILSFYDERAKIVIRESAESFFTRIELADYGDIPEELIVELEKEEDTKDKDNKSE